MLELFLRTEPYFLLLSAALLLLGAAYEARRKYLRNKVRVTRNISLLSAISPDDFFNPGEVTTPGGLQASTYLMLGDKYRQSGYHVTVVPLPFGTDCHIVGIPTAQLGNLRAIDKSFEEIDLEGDYGNYFKLYAAPKSQIKARYILDPAAMAVTIDFFERHYWEIRHSTLFVSSHTEIADESSLDIFVEAIRPAIITSNENLSSQDWAPRHYTQGNQASCPVCDQKLIGSEYWIGCPSGHGCIASDYQIISLRELHPHLYEQVEHYTHTQAVERPARIKCPRCKDHPAMKQTTFQKTQVPVDKCKHCRSYWLDHNELSQILKQTR